MEYSAAGVKYLLWYVETKETAKLMQTHNWKEIHQLAIEEIIYQQKATARAQSEFGCIKKRLEALPEDLIQKMITADIQTAKIITFISCMMTDRLLFEMMHEVYRNKIHYGETNISDSDLNIFIQNKREQSEKVESFSDATVKKLKQVYTKYMLEVGLISGKPSERIIAHPYIDTDVRMILMNNHMEQYLYALTGEA